MTSSLARRRFSTGLDRVGTRMPRARQATLAREGRRTGLVPVRGPDTLPARPPLGHRRRRYLALSRRLVRDAAIHDLERDAWLRRMYVIEARTKWVGPLADAIHEAPTPGPRP